MNHFELYYLILSPIYIYSVWLYFRVMFAKSHHSVLMQFSVCFIGYLAISISYLVINIPIVTSLTNHIFFYILSSLFTSKLKQKLLATVSLVGFLISIELIVASVFSQLSFQILQTNSYNSVPALLVTYLAEYAIVRFISFRKYRIHLFLPNKDLSYSQLIIPIASIIVLILLSIPENITELQFFLVSSFCFMVNLFLFEFFDYIAKKYMLNSEQSFLYQQQESYLQQLKLLNELNESNRFFQHDLTNRLIPLHSYAEKHHDEHLRKIVSEVSSVNPTGSKPFLSNHSTIESILNYKLAQSEELNIKIYAEITIPTKVNIQDTDLAILLGNLLDNAIDGCQTISSSRWININLEYGDSNLKIKIKNSFDGIVRSKQRGKITSRKADFHAHGLGLTSVQRIVEKYQGLVSIHYDLQQFEVRIVLMKV